MLWVGWIFEDGVGPCHASEVVFVLQGGAAVFMTMSD